MADAAGPPTKASSAPFVVFDAASATAKATKPKAAAAADANDSADAPRHGRRCRWLRWACCGLAIAGALAAAAVLTLSLTVLRVRDPTLSMDSIAVRHFSVHFDAARQLRINLTLSAAIVIRNPNYESMRFGASATEIFVADDGGGGTRAADPVGVGRASPGEVPARGASKVEADVDVLVDRVAPAVVAQVLFGDGQVRLATRTAVDGRISLLGGLYGRRTVRVAMRCRVTLRVSAAAVAVVGSPACVADFGR